MPVYAGRPISAWLFELESQDPLVKRKAEVAILGSGTNSMPILLQYISADTPVYRRFFDYYVKSILHSPEGRKSGSDQRRVALQAFFLLKQRGAEAASPLEQLLFSAAYKVDIATALSALGVQGRDALIRSCTAKQPSVRWAAVLALGDMDASDPVISSALERACTDLDPQVAAAAKNSLTRAIPGGRFTR